MVGSNADIVVSIFARIIWLFLFCQIQAKHSYKGNLLSTLNREQTGCQSTTCKRPN